MLVCCVFGLIFSSYTLHKHFYLYNAFIYSPKKTEAKKNFEKSDDKLFSNAIPNDKERNFSFLCQDSLWLKTRYSIQTKQRKIKEASWFETFSGCCWNISPLPSLLLCQQKFVYKFAFSWFTHTGFPGSPKKVSCKWRRDFTVKFFLNYFFTKSRTKRREKYRFWPQKR